MATQEQVSSLRERINDVQEPHTFTDAELGSIIDAGAGLDADAAYLWGVKASRYADMADVQEGSSRRSLSDLHSQALKMAAYWRARATGEDDGIRTMRPARTRPIVRP